MEVEVAQVQMQVVRRALVAVVWVVAAAVDFSVCTEDKYDEAVEEAAAAAAAVGIGYNEGDKYRYCDSIVVAEVAVVYNEDYSLLYSLGVGWDLRVLSGNSEQDVVALDRAPSLALRTLFEEHSYLLLVVEGEDLAVALAVMRRCLVVERCCDLEQSNCDSTLRLHLANSHSVVGRRAEH